MAWILCTPKPAATQPYFTRYYYSGYTVKGPTLSDNIEEAFRFLEQGQAENVRGGDERLRGWTVEFAP